ncbi:MAG: endo-1,4-beta-xylanase [Porcipelethomonas sp.]
MKMKKIFTGILSVFMFCTAVPVANAFADESVTTIYSADFEDGSNDFTGRDGLGTATVVDSGANGSSKCLEFSDRAKSWQGPQILLDDMCEPGVQYTVSAWVKTQWYNEVKLSMEYTDESGERHYSNVASAVSQGDWVQISPVKFSISENTTKNYIYFECNDTANIFLDDFLIETAPVYKIQEDIVSLKNVYSSYFKIGTAVTTDELAPQSTKDLILKHFNSLTPGNELKPESILDKNACLSMAAAGDDTNPQVNIASARTILNFCRDNNIPVRGHVLVWHSQTPDWFFKINYDENDDWVTEEVMLKRMENYIKNVFAALEEEYPTVNFYAWDVVNEAWLDNGVPRTGGTQAENSNYSGWVKVFGDNSFIEPAFEYARKYAPEGCKLYYNDFNEYMPQKTEAIYDMAMDLKEKGLIDGIGMQSHLDVGFPSVSTYEKALSKFVSTGLDIQVTELDITTSDTSEAGFANQAEIYSGIMDACVKYADNISAVVFWGTTDDKSWRASKYPLLFNEDYTAKEAFYSIVDGLTEPEPTDPTDPTNPDDAFVPGDLNNDGKINVFDSVILKKYLMEPHEVPAVLVSSPYDTDGNGTINLADLMLLNEYLLGKDVTLKVNTAD